MEKTKLAITGSHLTTSQPMIRPVQHEMLLAHGRYHYLSYAQMRRLLGYSPNSLRYLQKQYQPLVRSGLLLQIPMPRFGRYGRPAVVHHLTWRGMQYLRSAGYEVWHRFHAGEISTVGILHLQHTLAVNDFLIALAVLCRRYPVVSVAAMQHERELKRQPVAVTIADEREGRTRTVRVAPDAWVDVRVGRKRRPLALELDRGTEGQRAIRAKCQSLLAYAQGPYQAALGAQSLTICVLTTHSETRRDALRRWIAAELDAAGNPPGGADLFRIAHADPATIEPETLFCAPLWYRPGDDTPFPLLEGVLEEG